MKTNNNNDCYLLGRRMRSYQTNGEIDAGPSFSGRGGGRIP